MEWDCDVVNDVDGVWVVDEVRPASWWSSGPAYRRLKCRPAATPPPAAEEPATVSRSREDGMTRSADVRVEVAEEADEEDGDGGNGDVEAGVEVEVAEDEDEEDEELVRVVRS
jgi:hypothetical protein